MANTLTITTRYGTATVAALDTQFFEGKTLIGVVTLLEEIITNVQPHPEDNALIRFNGIPENEDPYDFERHLDWNGWFTRLNDVIDFIGINPDNATYVYNDHGDNYQKLLDQLAEIRETLHVSQPHSAGKILYTVTQAERETRPVGIATPQTLYSGLPNDLVPGVISLVFTYSGASESRNGEPNLAISAGANYLSSPLMGNSSDKTTYCPREYSYDEEWVVSQHLEADSFAPGELGYFGNLAGGRTDDVIILHHVTNRADIIAGLEEFVKSPEFPLGAFPAILDMAVAVTETALESIAENPPRNSCNYFDGSNI